MNKSILPILASIMLMFLVVGCSNNGSGAMTYDSGTSVPSSNASGATPSTPSTPTTSSQGAGTVITPDATILYRTYGGFLSPKFAVKEFMITPSTLTYSVLDSNNATVRSVSIPMDGPLYSQLVDALNANNFADMNDMYGGNNPDVGSFDLMVSQPGFTKTLTVGTINGQGTPPASLDPITQNINAIGENILTPAAPDYFNYGYTTVLSSSTIPANRSMSINAGPYVFFVPVDIFSTDVKFEVLQADPSLIQAYAPDGEMPVATFALRITDLSTGFYIQNFTGIQWTVNSDMIDTNAKFYDVQPDDSYIDDMTNTNVRLGVMSNTIYSAGIAYAITEPAPSNTTMTQTQVQTYNNTSNSSTTSINNMNLSLKASNTQSGLILIDNNGMTLYTFAADPPSSSTCYDACAVAWPPVLVGNYVAPNTTSDITGNVGVIQRTDGMYQVTYDDMPLYYFVKDLNPGDTKGNGVNGFGAFWHDVYLSQPSTGTTSSGY